MKVISFNVRFKDDERDQKLLDKLIAEAEGILAWMVKGCKLWNANGITDCAAVIETTRGYRTDEDAFSRFFKGKVQVRIGATVPVEALWKAYNT